MNIIDMLNNRIDTRASEVKNMDIKGYKSYAAAYKVGVEKAEEAGNHFETAPVHWMVIWNETTQRFYPVFNMSEMLRRPDCAGGYVGVLAAQGFLCW